MASSFEEEIETPEMESLGSLAENIVYRLPGCTDVMVRKTLQDVYRDFCRRSCCLCGRRHCLLTSDGDVTVCPMFGGVVDCIAEVRYNGRVLGGRDFLVEGMRVIFRNGLVPYRDTEEARLPRIDILAIEYPKLNSEDIPLAIVGKFGEGICSGVLARLMAMTGKAWTDAAQANIENIRYENAVNEARMRYYARNENGNLGCAIGNDELL